MLALNAGFGSGWGSDFRVPSTTSPWALAEAPPTLTFSVVPEPSTLVLAGAALVGLAGYGIRRRRSAAKQAAALLTSEVPLMSRTPSRFALATFALSAALGLHGMGNSAYGVVVNSAVLSDISATDTAINSSMYSIQLTDGQNVIGASYIQDGPNNAQYVGNGYGNGVNIGDGTITIQNYTDGQSVAHDKSIVMTTTETAPPDGGAPLYFDTAPINLVTTDSLSVSFAVDLVSNEGVTTNAFNNAAFAANIFTEYTSATRFVASPTSTTGGVFGLTKADGSLFTVGTYNNDTFYNIDVNLNFLSQTATLGINGVESDPIGFRNTFATTPQLTEVFFYQGASVPEPSTMVLAGLGVAALLAARLRLARRNAAEANRIVAS